MFRPSSMMSVPQREQATLHGSSCPGRRDAELYQRKPSVPFSKATSDLWKMAAHWKGAPCIVWQSLQWQNLDARGLSRLSLYVMFPQWQTPRSLRSNPRWPGGW